MTTATKELITETEEKDIGDLAFIRIIDPSVFADIPRYLFEQIKEMDKDMLDATYKNALNIMMIPILNEKSEIVCYLPRNNVWFAVLRDESRQTKGFLWLNFNNIERYVYIKAYSLDPEYQSSGLKKGKKILLEYLRNLPIPNETKTTVRMTTTRPRIYERYGWKRSNKVLMEFRDVVHKTTK